MRDDVVRAAVAMVANGSDWDDVAELHELTREDFARVVLGRMKNPQTEEVPGHE